jgi:hypothetical protein
MRSVLNNCAMPSVPNSYCLAITALGALTTPPNSSLPRPEPPTPRRIVPSGLDHNRPEEPPRHHRRRALKLLPSRTIRLSSFSTRWAPAPPAVSMRRSTIDLAPYLRRTNMAATSRRACCSARRNSGVRTSEAHEGSGAQARCISRAPDERFITGHPGPSARNGERHGGRSLK